VEHEVLAEWCGLADLSFNDDVVSKYAIPSEICWRVRRPTVNRATDGRHKRVAMPVLINSWNTYMVVAERT
jgi:hypothetical protein